MSTMARLGGRPFVVCVIEQKQGRHVRQQYVLPATPKYKKSHSSAVNKSLFSRASLGNRVAVGVPVAPAPISALSLCCWLPAHKWLVYVAANRAEHEFDWFRSALLTTKTPISS